MDNDTYFCVYTINMYGLCIFFPDEKTVGFRAACVVRGAMDDYFYL